jgi:hypothetical protein
MGTERVSLIGKFSLLVKQHSIEETKKGKRGMLGCLFFPHDEDCNNYHQHNQYS